MNPALVACMVFGFAAILSFSYWWQQRAPRISSNTLLVRAEKWDTPNFASTSGVVYQSVRINLSKQMKKETITRSIYRDTQGKRRPKRVNLDGEEQQLASTLTAAGLDWDEPLSATGYQNWHDRQRVREDNIVRAGSHLLPADDHRAGRSCGGAIPDSARYGLPCGKADGGPPGQQHGGDCGTGLQDTAVGLGGRESLRADRRSGHIHSAAFRPGAHASRVCRRR